jgi:hypothetical protein
MQSGWSWLGPGLHNCSRDFSVFFRARLNCRSGLKSIDLAQDRHLDPPKQQEP